MPDDAPIEAEAPHPWASRGGVKLAAALDAFALDPAGLVCLDVGASTGGFTDVLLARGAAKVIAVDVGHGQLDPRLAADPRVRSLEGVDARALTAEMLGERPGAIVIDVSFISQRLVLPHVLKLARERAWLVSLVKPQFELGKADLVKGRVRSEAALDARLRRRARGDRSARLDRARPHSLADPRRRGAARIPDRRAPWLNRSKRLRSSRSIRTGTASPPMARSFLSPCPASGRWSSPRASARN